LPGKIKLLLLVICQAVELASSYNSKSSAQTNGAAFAFSDKYSTNIKLIPYYKIPYTQVNKW